MTTAATSSPARFLKRAGVQGLIDALLRRGYEVVGPTIDQGAIVYDTIRRVEDMPVGWSDEQEKGRYRLVRRNDERIFGYVVGPHSWKQFLFPPLATLATARRTAQGWDFRSAEDETPRYALLGVRACELAALHVQDRVFMEGEYVDPIYSARRKAAFVVAVNCTQAAATCFCTSMGTGPRCTAGFDVGLTELDEGFVVEIGSDTGAEVIAELETAAVESHQVDAAQAARQQAVDQISRQLDTTDIRDVLLDNLDHPHWGDVASRCLSCTNCTMVCPTCFCHSTKELSDLAGDNVERRREWDSCFNVSFSYMNGGAVRGTIRSRYRQWLTHKLATWIDQFGTSGCVGCGRCITWCPVGIDLTEEVAAIRESTAK